jgi:putative oxidoreductase
MPVVGALLTGTMTTAIRKVHLDRGFWNTGGGYEFNLALVAAAIALIDSGPGRPSVDEALGLRLKGSGWGARGARGRGRRLERRDRAGGAHARPGGGRLGERPLPA